MIFQKSNGSIIIDDKIPNDSLAGCQRLYLSAMNTTNNSLRYQKSFHTESLRYFQHFMIELKVWNWKIRSIILNSFEYSIQYNSIRLANLLPWSVLCSSGWNIFRCAAELSSRMSCEYYFSIFTIINGNTSPFGGNYDKWANFRCIFMMDINHLFLQQSHWLEWVGTLAILGDIGFVSNVIVLSGTKNDVERIEKEL